MLKQDNVIYMIFTPSIVPSETGRIFKLLVFC